MAIDKKWATRPLELFRSDSIAEFDALIDEMYAPDCILHDPGMPNFGRGPEPVKQFMHSAVEQDPNMHIVVQDAITEGDTLAIRFTVYGTDAATGKPDILELMCFSRFVNGKIVEEWELGMQVPQPVEA